MFMPEIFLRTVNMFKFKGPSSVISVRRLCRKIDSNTISAGIIATGNEILKGDIMDTNSHFLCQQLHKLGITVRKMSVVADEIDAISEEVIIYSKTFKYVITTGGIGPTHDDVTFEGVAKAFKQPLVYNPELIEKCYKFFHTRDLNAPGMKLAKIPQLAKLNYDSMRQVKYPTISVNNVYMFPGVPELLEKSFLYVGASLFQSKEKFYLKTVYVNLNEDKCVQFLDMIVKKYPYLNVGSYPEYANQKYKVRITLESPDEILTFQAYEELMKMLPGECVVYITESD